MMFKKSICGNGCPENYAQRNRHAPQIALDLTSNPLGCPKGAARVAARMDAEAMLNYPRPPEMPELLAEIAKRSGIGKDEVMVTAGADQAIEIVLTHLLDEGDALGVLAPTFPRFEIVGRALCGAKIRLFHGMEELPKNCKAVCVCTPNNPTTDEIGMEKLADAIRSNPKTFFVVDSVFAEFGRQKASVLVKKFHNVAVLKSVSKSFGLPGLRVGWIESQKGNIEKFKIGATPFRVPVLSQKIALAALADRAHIMKTKKFLAREFRKISFALGERVCRKSDVPFFVFWTDGPKKARLFLLKMGIGVVDSASFSGEKKGFLRIAIGSRKQNEMVGKTLLMLQNEGFA